MPEVDDTDFSAIRGGPFEAALRKRLGVGEDFLVQVEPSGGGEYQIGDYTWDTEPYRFAVTAQPMRWQTTPDTRHSVLMGDVERWSERKEIEFNSHP